MIQAKKIITTSLVDVWVNPELIAEIRSYGEGSIFWLEGDNNQSYTVPEPPREFANRVFHAVLGRRAYSPDDHIYRSG